MGSPTNAIVTLLRLLPQGPIGHSRPNMSGWPWVTGQAAHRTGPRRQECVGAHDLRGTEEAPTERARRRVLVGARARGDRPSRHDPVVHVPRAIIGTRGLWRLCVALRDRRPSGDTRRFGGDAVAAPARDARRRAAGTNRQVVPDLGPGPGDRPDRDRLRFRLVDNRDPLDGGDPVDTPDRVRHHAGAQPGRRDGAGYDRVRRRRGSAYS